MDAEWLNGFYLKATEFGLRALSAIVIIVVGRWIAGIISRMAERALVKSKLDATLANFLKNLTYFTILIFVFIAALNKLGVETTSFVAIIGAAGLAVGLALQGALSNFAAGVMIVVFHPFKVGDTIETSGAVGVVTEIQIFNTVLVSPDKKTVIIPNAKITSDKIVVAVHHAAVVLLIAAFSLIASGNAFAQESVDDPVKTAAEAVPTAQEAPAQPVVVTYPWAGSIFAGYTHTSGNTDNLAATLALEISKKYGKSLFLVKGNVLYSETDNNMDGQKWDGLVKNTHDFGKDDRWFSFVQVLVDHDYFSDIDYRVTPSAGVGYHIARSEEWTWDVDAGLGYRITRHRNNTAADDESLTAVAHTFMKKKILDNAFISEDLTVYPGLKADAGITLRSETVFTNPLSTKLDLELKYIVDYNSEPAAGMTTTDKKFIAGVKYKF